MYIRFKMTTITYIYFWPFGVQNCLMFIYFSENIIFEAVSPGLTGALGENNIPRDLLHVSKQMDQISILSPNCIYTYVRSQSTGVECLESQANLNVIHQFYRLLSYQNNNRDKKSYMFRAYASNIKSNKFKYSKITWLSSSFLILLCKLALACN